MIDKERLAAKCAAYGIALTAQQLDRLDAYARLLVDYNQKVNLTAITTPEGIEDRHFADSLLLAAQPEVAGAVVDVGTGAGFPGIVAKIYRPDIRLTLMEPTGKRVDFLRYACAELGLEGVEFAKERAEEAARKPWREQFDIACARAVAALPVLCEYEYTVYTGCFSTKTNTYYYNRFDDFEMKSVQFTEENMNADKVTIY